MSVTKAKSVETTPVKKILKRKVVEKAPVEKVKKSEQKNVKEVTPKKEVAKKEVVEEEVVEKTPKKINVKPTLADICGLNLSVAKIKNIISSLCINKDTFAALKEMKEHRKDITVIEATADTKKTEGFTFTLDGLSGKTLSYLDECSASLRENKELLYSRKVTRDMTKEQVASYNEAKRIAIAAFQADQKNGHLFQQSEFNLNAFNLGYDPKFYARVYYVPFYCKYKCL